MGVQENLGCAGGAKYCVEVAEGRLDGCFDWSSDVCSSDLDWGPREIRDSCSGHSSAAYPGQPGAPSHHWGADDDCGECVEWDLIWVGPNDVGVAKATLVALQAASEP